MERIRLVKALFSVGAIIFCGCLAPQAAVSKGKEPIDSSTYTYKQVDGESLRLDVYSPASRMKTGDRLPVIILFHGGSWKAGDRHQMRFQCRYFAAKGLVAVTADYRLLGKDASLSDPDRRICLMDAKSAVRWVKSHAALLHIDTSRVILGGGSAGGQLATMAALNPNLNDQQDDTTISTNANALILFNPAYQLNDAAALEPFGFVSPAYPPVVMFFGSDDHWKKAADTLYRALLHSGIQSQLWIASGERHGFFNKKGWNQATSRQADLFLHHLHISDGNAEASPAGFPLQLEEGRPRGE